MFRLLPAYPQVAHRRLTAARAQALREFGDIEDARHYIRSMDRAAEVERRRRDIVGDFRQDLVYAARKLRSSA